MKLVGASLSWIALSTLIGICFGYTPWRLSTPTAAISLAAALVTVIVVTFIQKKPTRLARPSSNWFVGTIIAIVFLFFAATVFGRLIFVTDDQVKVLSVNNIGDICLHLTHINFLASGPRFWPANPIFAFDLLRYPVGLNIFNAELKLVGIEPIAGIIGVAFFCSFLTLRSLFLFNGPFGVAAFLFNGGVAGFLFFQSFELKDYQADLAWKSIPLAMFVTQRGLLYAIPAGLLLLHHWRTRLFQKRQDRGLPFWVEWLLYASMPIFHLHTFLFLSLLLFWWFLFGDKSWRLHLIRLVAFSCLPASFFVYVVTGFAKTGALGWKPGWMAGPNESAFWFWFHNFGFFLPLSLALLVYLLLPGKPSDQEARKQISLFYFPATILFVICAFIKFAPWEWDNTKLFLWAYLTMIYCLWEAFISKWRIIFRIPVLFLLFFSGFVSLAAGLFLHPEGYGIGKWSEWKGVEEASKMLPPEAVTAACPTYNHPLLVAGHRLVLGYEGHLWSHGLDYLPALADLDSLMSGDVNWETTARKLGVNYLFWGPMEQGKYPDSARGWEASCPVVAEGPWGKIYDLRNVPPPMPENSPVEKAHQ
jgi:hypothetical protein